MIPIATINLENSTIEEASNYEKRKAVRAIIFDDNNLIAMIHATNDKYYKLPGGGIEDGENIFEALARECKEEIGCEIEVQERLGEVVEYRRSSNLNQTSFCYIARIIGEKGDPNLTESEISGGFKTIWLSIEEAINNLNQSHPSFIWAKYMVARDLALLEFYLKK